MRIVYCGGHSILEYDEVKLLASLGHEVFSIGAYIHPSKPLDDKRPPLDVAEIPELIAAVDALGQQGHADTLMAAKDMGLPDAVLDWADVIIYAAFEHRWLAPNWTRLKGKRVVWRTIGQSADRNEAMMAPLARDGLQIVRYSPKERNIPGYAGEDALIRFYKDPAEWYGWNGEGGYIANVTQFLYQRSLANDGLLQPMGKQWTSYSYWAEATRGLPTKPAGPGSDAIHGTGPLDYEAMRQYLRDARCYIYTGTQPASYTLGLIEAMMTGVPVISITAEWMQIVPYGPTMFEGDEIAPFTASAREAGDWAGRLLTNPDLARHTSDITRRRAISMFGMGHIASQWQAFLVHGSLPTVQYAEAVA
jgi:hypothetical protein